MQYLDSKYYLFIQKGQKTNFLMKLFMQKKNFLKYILVLEEIFFF